MGPAGGKRWASGPSTQVILQIGELLKIAALRLRASLSHSLQARSGLDDSIATRGCDWSSPKHVITAQFKIFHQPPGNDTYTFTLYTKYASNPCY